ncbi:MAG: type IVB secretion system protein IcmH/DotU [Nitrospira sp.]|nr:type IVB secretion system protein IcmH/DotU [Nitrospira sp.]
MSASLLSLFSDPLVLGTSLRTAPDCGEPEALQSHLLDIFYQINQAGGDMGIPGGTLRLARYALAAYLDEMVMSSHWGKKHQWPAMSLQSELFNTDLAGQGFFQNLEEIWRGHPLNTDLLELYYLCLALGFEGKYKLQGREQLRALIQDLGRDLQTRRGEVPPLLDVPLPSAPPVKPPAAAIPWMLAVGAIALAIVSYGILIISITRNTDAVKTSLQDLAQKVPLNR